MTDLRAGDLVKATRSDQPELSITARLQYANDVCVGLPLYGAAYRDNWDFEVLDRPAPPIDEELVQGARRAFLAHSTIDQADWKAVINFVREYDQKNATKENA